MRTGRVLEVRSQEPDSSFGGEKFRDAALASLRSGQAEVAGHERVGGRDALKIVAQGGAETFLVDARDYTPIELRTRGTGGGTVLRFVAYERLPLTDATRDGSASRRSIRGRRRARRSRRTGRR